MTTRQVKVFACQDCDIPESLQVVEQSTAPQDCGMFRILSKDGDTRVVWNKLSLAEVRDAKEMFDDLVDKGMIPYLVGIDGKASTQVMSQFDPSAEEVIFLPMRAIVGG